MNSQSQPLGWARIIVHHQGDIDAGISPIFEGAFSADGVVHHVMTKENYLRTKLSLDPLLLSPLEDRLSPLVIFRDSDIMDHDEEEALRRTGFPLSSWKDSLGGSPVPDREAGICSHDHLAWNTDPWINPALRKSYPPTWYEKLGFRDDPAGSNVSMWNKRDDVAGGTMNSKCLFYFYQRLDMLLIFPPALPTKLVRLPGVLFRNRSCATLRLLLSLVSIDSADIYGCCGRLQIRPTVWIAAERHLVYFK